MNVGDGFSAANLAANSAAFSLKGGLYAFIASGSSGNVTPEVLGPDGTTFIGVKDINGNAVTCNSAAAAVYQVAWLPPGEYKLVCTGTLTGLDAELVSVPI